LSLRNAIFKRETIFSSLGKNLRLNSSRFLSAANSHLGVIQFTHIEFDLCANETAALKYEAKLIRELKPKFNRAGVWQGKPQFLVWRYSEIAIEFSVQEVPEVGWERFGNLGAYANRIKCVLVRLIWLAMNPDKSFVQMQLGWMQDRMNGVVGVECGVEELRAVLNEAFWGSSGVFLNWLAIRLNTGRPAFERVAIQKDMDELKEFLEQDRLDRKTGQMGLL
jgi:hypothetical protein